MAGTVTAACGGRSDAGTARNAASDGAPAAPRATATAQRPESSVERRRILFIGTSLTSGYGLDIDSAYPALIARKIDSAGLPFEVVNAGVDGETSAGARRRIGWLLRDSVDVIVLETGANDGLRALNIDSTRANIQAILDEIRSRRPRATVLLVQMEAPPNFGVAYTQRFRGMYPSLARENRVTLVPFLLDGVAGVFELNQSDGIHPNEAGARRVAENVWRTLGPVLKAME